MPATGVAGIADRSAVSGSQTGERRDRDGSPRSREVHGAINRG